MLLLSSISMCTAQIDWTPYIDEVTNGGFDFIGNFGSLEAARDGTRGQNNIIYVIQRLQPNGNFATYIGETIRDVASRYGELTAGLRDVIPDRFEAVGVTVDVYQIDAAVDRTDEAVLRLARDDMMNGTADARMRLRNRRGLVRGMTRQERADFRAHNVRRMRFHAKRPAPAVDKEAITKEHALVIPKDVIEKLLKEKLVILLKDSPAKVPPKGKAPK